MSQTGEKIVSEALGLSPAERGLIAVRIIESLDSESDEDAALAWESEIGRRLDEMDAGMVEMFPWQKAPRMI